MVSNVLLDSGASIRLARRGKFVVYKAHVVGATYAEFVQRREALRDMVQNVGVTHVMLDFRGVSLSLSPDFFQAVIKAPGLRSGARWTIAVLVDQGSEQYSIEVARDLVALLASLHHEAKLFSDYPAAADWLSRPDQAPPSHRAGNARDAALAP